MPNAYEIITDKIIAALDQGIIPWRKPWTVSRPQNIDGRPYSGINAIILGMSGYSDARCVDRQRKWDTFGPENKRDYCR